MSRALRRRQKKGVKTASSRQNTPVAPQPPDQARFETALAAQRGGQWAQAESLYREILRDDPAHLQATHLLGVLYSEMGQYAQAVSWIEKALHIRPDFAEAHNNLGNVWLAQGRFAEAVTCYRSALRYKPDFFVACYNLGNACKALGQWELALEGYRRAVTLYPDFAEAYLNMGSILHARERIAEAAECYRHSLALRPDYPEALVNWGLMLQEQGHLSQAQEQFQRAVTIRPSYPEAWSRWGVALQDAGDLHGAMEKYQRALSLRPRFPEALSHLGGALLSMERLTEAQEALHAALAMNPSSPEALSNLGSLLHKQGRMEEALHHFFQAQVNDPQFAEAYFGAGLTQLLLGDYQSGWQNYEWRWRTKGFQPHGHQQPLWDGSSLSGRRILLHCEQGLGDSVQFIRFIPMVKEKGGTVVVICPPSLHRLFSQIKAIDLLVSRLEDIPRCDCQMPLMSLAKVFAITLETIPAPVAYLTGECEDSIIKKRLSLLPGLKVGLVWRGNPRYKNDHIRSISASMMAPLLAVTGCSFVSLQKEVQDGDRELFSQGCIDLSAELTDFADTASALACLDLLISVDTAVLHVAGALGRPAWGLLPYVPDWRWLMDKEESPWYPSVRLFRQSQPGAWQGVIEAIVGQLQRVVQGK
ncbi:MAG: tetratricopeptide repeat protein [Magnetococcales bacterium]|nr:tetratricopeptide repeat protein [Magnetococcales bacterium]